MCNHTMPELDPIPMMIRDGTIIRAITVGMQPARIRRVGLTTDAS